MSENKDPKDEQYTLLITNLTRDQQAIIARQDKLETLLNSQQVLLATLIEQHRQHEDEMKNFADEMKDMKKDSTELSKAVVAIDGRVSAIRWILGVAGSVLLILLSAILSRFVH